MFEAADRWYSADHEGSGSGEVLNLSDPVANGKMEWYSWYYRDAEDLEIEIEEYDIDIMSAEVA